jgi:hypothetical protein
MVNLAVLCLMKRRRERRLMSLLTKRVYQDPRGRLHDENTGKFVPKPRKRKSAILPESETVPLYFTKDEEKEFTYNRAGVILEIEKDDDEIFVNLAITGWVVGIVWVLVGKIF